MAFPIETLPAGEIHPALLRKIGNVVDAAVSREKPVLIHTLGVPGAGKSTFVSVLTGQMGAHKPPVVSFDALMESIPEYQAEPSKEKAFKMFEIPARMAGYFLIRKMLEKRANVFLDHGGSFENHIDLLKYARDEQGYKIIVVHVATDPETAKRRIHARQGTDGRTTPLAYVSERHAIIEKLLGKYKSVAHDFFEVSNDCDQADRAAYFAEKGADIARCWEKSIA